MGKLTKVSLVVFIILLIDQSIKVWVKTNMAYGEQIQLFGLDWALIHFVENPGMAFGMTLGDGDIGKLALSLFRILAVIFLLIYIRILLNINASMGILLSFALILAGAIGNIIDSAFYGLIFSNSPFHSTQVATIFPAGGGYAGFLQGNVVDMFYFPVWKGYFPEWLPLLGGRKYDFFKPVFNIADVAITMGVLNILLFQRNFFIKHYSAENEDTSNYNLALDEMPLPEDDQLKNPRG